jgi:hypothetical protein
LFSQKEGLVLVVRVLVGSLVYDTMPSPHLVWRWLYFISMGVYDDKGIPQTILRGELESMSKKIKEKRNDFGENGMHSLGRLTPDRESC